MRISRRIRYCTSGSLAIEEQIYLVWPLALGGAFALTRRLGRRQQMRAVRIAVAVGAVASAVWALSLRTSNPNRAYYGADTRAYELLAGTLIALVPAFVAAAARYRRSMATATIASTGALLALASSWVDLDAIERGVVVTIATCLLIVAPESSGGGVVKRVLSHSSVVYLFLPICDPVVNGQIVKRDKTDLTAPLAKTIAAQVDTYLEDTGLIAAHH